MQRIIVKNFGPLKDIDLEIKDFMVFIGPNASGKSTLAKLIYAFQSFPNFLHSHYVLNYRTQDFGNKEKLYSEFYKNYLPLVFNIDLYVEFHFDNFKKLILTKSNIIDGKNAYNFQDNFSSFFENIPIEETLNLNDSVFFKETSIFSRSFRQYISINFYDPIRQTFFIPEQKSFIDKNQIEAKTYLNLLSDTKNEFLNNIFFYNNEKLIAKILKGTPSKIYESEFGIYIDNENFVNFDLLSSGQKENYWFLLSLIYLKVNYYPSNLFIEEPENHLFPESQKEIIEFLIGFFNNYDLKLLITTHSHYIIGVINVLINAHRIGKLFPEKVEKVIPKEYWLDKEKVFIGKLNDGKLEDVYSKEAEIFDHEELTQTSGVLNEEYSQLLEIEYESDK